MHVSIRSQMCFGPLYECNVSPLPLPAHFCAMASTVPQWIRMASLCAMVCVATAAGLSAMSRPEATSELWVSAARTPVHAVGSTKTHNFLWVPRNSGVLKRQVLSPSLCLSVCLSVHLCLCVCLHYSVCRGDGAGADGCSTRESLSCSMCGLGCGCLCHALRLSTQTHQCLSNTACHGI